MCQFLVQQIKRRTWFYFTCTSFRSFYKEYACVFLSNIRCITMYIIACFYFNINRDTNRQTDRQTDRRIHTCMYIRACNYGHCMEHLSILLIARLRWVINVRTAEEKDRGTFISSPFSRAPPFSSAWGGDTCLVSGVVV